MAESTETQKQYTVVFLRHGESEWIQKSIYCGWYDSDISRNGENEVEKAGEILRDAGYVFDEVHTSVLRRAWKTANIIKEVMKQPNITVHKTWHLNARHYGALTGLTKGETIRKFGEDQTKIWRRSYDVPPPEIPKDNPYYDIILDDPIYKDGPSKENFPLFESLKQAIERTLPYWKETIEPKVRNGKNILVIGHMNSLRAIIKHLDRISDEKIMEYNIPTGIPFIYELDRDMKPVVSLKFLGDEEMIKTANDILSATGKGFERPKRSKGSKLEVYDSVKKRDVEEFKTLATVQSQNETKSLTPDRQIEEMKLPEVISGMKAAEDVLNVESIKEIEKIEKPDLLSKSIKSAKSVRDGKEELYDDYIAEGSFDLGSEDIEVDKVSTVTSKLTPTQATALIKDTEQKEIKGGETKPKKDEVEIDKPVNADL